MTKPTQTQTPTYILSSSQAQSLAKSQNKTLPDLLPSLVPQAQDLARPPISKFHVGTVGLSSDGRVFFGANIEFPGLPLHHSIHAEQFLITNMSLHGGGPRLLYMAVSAAPCGHCRQFLQELRDVSSTMIMITNDNEGYRPIKDILPHPFGPFDLLAQYMPLVLEEHKNDIFFNDECENLGNLSNGYLESAKKNDGAAARGSHAPYDTENFGNLSNGYLELAKKNDGLLKSEALAAARGSHAPYSGCPSGVALMDCDGNVYKGMYMESAAYNPSMMPVQAALVAYMVGGGGGYDRIVAAVLVEKEGAMVSQEETARLLLKHISPKCELRVFHCV
ncbi:cytidine deaminase 1-like protein [Tanacetum coccineum]